MKNNMGLFILASPLKFMSCYVQCVLQRKGINTEKTVVMSLIKTPAKAGVICNFHKSIRAGLGFLCVSGLLRTPGWLVPASGSIF